MTDQTPFPQAAKEPRLYGVIDVLRADRVAGWVIDRTDAARCATVEYPSWSRAVRKPISPFAQQGVCKDDDAPHDGGNGDFLRFAGL